MARRDGSLIVTLAISKEKLQNLNPPAHAAEAEKVQTEVTEEVGGEIKKKEGQPESMDTTEDGPAEDRKSPEDAPKVLEESIQPSSNSENGTAEKNVTPQTGTGIAVT